MSAAVAASDLHRDAVASRALQRDLAMLVYLPDGYDGSTQKYPVLYLLHGASDTEQAWIDDANIQGKLDNLISSGAMAPSIVVMPGCKGCWWVDSPGSKMETAFWSDLVPQLENRYRADGTGGGRFLLGISAGGHGAVRFAMKYPGRITAVAALSPAAYHATPPVTSCARQSEAFRGADGQFSQDLWAANNYTNFIQEFARRHSPLPIYLLSGDSDLHKIGFETTLLFNALHDIQPEVTKLRIVDGGHTWGVWAPALDDAIRYLYRPIGAGHA